MGMSFILSMKALAKALVLPPAGPILLALAGLLLSLRHPRTGRAVTAASLLALLASATPAVTGLLLEALPQFPAFSPAAAHDAGAVVILGGGIRREAPDYGGDTIATLTLERVRYGARIARQTGLPVLVSGGLPLASDKPEAVLMREVLEQEFRVPVRWVERKSANTRENALFSGRLLKEAGIHRIVLVMHGFDMPRAVREFTANGIDVVPAPTVIPGNGTLEPADFLPGMTSLQMSYYALYELLALAVQRPR